VIDRGKKPPDDVVFFDDMWQERPLASQVQDFLLCNHRTTSSSEPTTAI